MFCFDIRSLGESQEPEFPDPSPSDPLLGSLLCSQPPVCACTPRILGCSILDCQLWLTTLSTVTPDTIALWMYPYQGPWRTSGVPYPHGSQPLGGSGLWLFLQAKFQFYSSLTQEHLLRLVIMFLQAWLGFQLLLKLSSLIQVQGDYLVTGDRFPLHFPAQACFFGSSAVLTYIIIVFLLLFSFLDSSAKLHTYISFCQIKPPPSLPAGNILEYIPPSLSL